MSAGAAEARVLAGKRVVVTRAAPQAHSLSARLEALGADVRSVPTIRITEPSDAEPLRRAAREAGRFDWIIFTSANGVASFWEALRKEGGDARSLAGVSLCAIGSATAKAVANEGAQVDLVPPQYVAESIVESLEAKEGLAGKRVLLPRAELARDVLPDALRARGADVLDVPAYRTLADASFSGALKGWLSAGEIDIVIFTSSSTVRSFVEQIGADAAARLRNVTIACIGPITSATAGELGLRVDIEAGVHTSEGLVEAIRQHFAREYGAPSTR